MTILRAILLVFGFVLATGIAWGFGLNPDYVFGHLVHLLMLAMVIKLVAFFWKQRKPPENPLRPGMGRALRNADVIELIKRRDANGKTRL